MKSVTQLLKENFALWGLISFLILVILPVASGVAEPYLKIFMSLGSALFVALTVSYFVNKKIAASTNYEIKELIGIQFPKLLEMEAVGLERIVYENNMEALEIDLVNSSELYVVMNDGKNFFTNNSKKLSERFKKENRTTYVILLSDSSDSESVLNKRNGKAEPGYYGRKIRECIKDYAGFHENCPSTNILKIFKYDFHFTMSIVATENRAVIGTYRNAAGKAIVPPHFIFENKGNGCEYKNIKDDLKNLIKNATECDISIPRHTPQEIPLK